MSPTVRAGPDPASPEGVTFFGNARAINAAWKAHDVSNPFVFGMLAQRGGRKLARSQREGRPSGTRPNEGPDRLWPASMICAAPDPSTSGGLQSALAALRFKIAVDGQIGEKTEGVLQSFQFIAGLPPSKADDDTTKVANLKALSDR